MTITEQLNTTAPESPVDILMNTSPGFKIPVKSATPSVYRQQNHKIEEYSHKIRESGRSILAFFKRVLSIPFCTFCNLSLRKGSLGSNPAINIAAFS